MNNQNDNQTNPPTSDQDVLNKYASSIKPNTVEVPPKTIFSQDLDDTNDNSLEVKMSEAPKTTPLLDPPFVPQPQPSEKPLDSIPPQSTEITNSEVKESLKEFNSIPIDTPTPTSLSDNLEPSKSLIDESSSVIENEPEFKPEPELEPIIQTETNSLTTPQEDPEIIKQKIEEVLSYTTASNIVNSTSDKPKTSGFLKTLFFLSLFIFIGVVGVLGYFITNPVSKTNSDPKTTINPTTVPTQTGVTCELNGFIYTQGQSFPSADGCNTCTCVSVDNVTCTDKPCSGTTTTPTTNSAAKTTLAPTKTATTSSTPKLSPEKTVQTFYQDYIKTSPLSYENSPYLTLSLIKLLDETKNKITSSDPVLNSSIIPDCGVTTDEAVIKNNSATVTVFLCHKNEGKQYLSIDLVLENSQWKINKISLP